MNVTWIHTVDGKSRAQVSTMMEMESGEFQRDTEKNACIISIDSLHTNLLRYSQPDTNSTANTGTKVDLYWDWDWSISKHKGVDIKNLKNEVAKKLISPLYYDR